jgi:hypothetical protein
MRFLTDLWHPLRLTAPDKRRHPCLRTDRRYQVEALVATFGTWKMDCNEGWVAIMEDARSK